MKETDLNILRRMGGEVTQHALKLEPVTAPIETRSAVQHDPQPSPSPEYKAERFEKPAATAFTLSDQRTNLKPGDWAVAATMTDHSTGAGKPYEPPKTIMEIRVDDRGRQTRVEVPRASEVKPTTRADTRMAEIYRDMKRDEGETLRALSSASPPLEYAHVDDPRGGGLVTNLDATLNLTTSINGLKDTLNRLLRGK